MASCHVVSFSWRASDVQIRKLLDQISLAAQIKGRLKKRICFFKFMQVGHLPEYLNFMFTQA